MQLCELRIDMDSEHGPGGGCDPCACNGTDMIVDVDTEFFTLVMGCTIASFLGFFGSVYVLLSNVGVIVRLQAKLRHQLWHYLLNGGFLIILMAIGEGTLGFFLYRASINSALCVEYCCTIGCVGGCVAWTMLLNFAFTFCVLGGS